MKRPIWKNPLALAIVASLGLNIFFGAQLIGRHIPGLGRDGATHSGPRQAIEAFLRQASPETRDRFAVMRRAHRDGADERREARRRAQDAVAAAIEADPFEPARLEAAILAARAADQRGPRPERFAAFLRDVPAAERAILATELRKIRDRRGDRGDRGGG